MVGGQINDMDFFENIEERELQILAVKLGIQIDVIKIRSTSHIKPSNGRVNGTIHLGLWVGFCRNRHYYSLERSE